MSPKFLVGAVSRFRKYTTNPSTCSREQQSYKKLWHGTYHTDILTQAHNHLQPPLDQISTSSSRFNATTKLSNSCGEWQHKLEKETHTHTHNKLFHVGAGCAKMRLQITRHDQEFQMLTNVKSIISLFPIQIQLLRGNRMSPRHLGPQLSQHADYLGKQSLHGTRLF